MNIFFLDEDVEASARFHGDRHVGKMLMEANQMMAAAIRRHTGDARFSAAYANHPMTRWVGDSRANFLYALRYAEALAREWRHRYGREHGSAARLPVHAALAEAVPDGPPTPPPLCMPERYRIGGAVASYRAYYAAEKAPAARWTRREPPPFLSRPEE